MASNDKQLNIKREEEAVSMMSQRYRSMMLLVSIFFLSSCMPSVQAKDFLHSPAHPTISRPGSCDPWVNIDVSPNAIVAGRPVTITVDARALAGLDTFWWYGNHTGIADLDKAHMVSGAGQVTGQNTWSISINKPGTYSFGANARDLRYPEPGVPHQASEGCGLAYDSITVGVDIGDWLNTHPAVAASIQWERPSATPNDMVAYPAWTTDMKNDLAQACLAVVRGKTAGLPPIPDTELTLDGNGNVWALQVQKDLAWRYYTAYVAQSLMAEVQNWFPWSLNNYSAQALAALFDSRTLFGWGTGPQRYTVKKMHNLLLSQGAATPGDPGTTLQMIESLGLAGTTPKESLDKIFAWSRDHLVHFYGSETPENNMAHWGFRGYPPVQKILEGTNRQIAGGGTEFGHWTAGCWGTTAFIKLAGKVLNIPVELVKLRSGTGFHATPHFIAEGRYWSHADDPYNWLSREFIPATPPVAAGEYFIDEATYQSWFGTSVPAADSGKNVGKRVAHVAVQYLTDYLLQKHCDDLSHQRGHAGSQVYSSLSPYYTVAELEAQNLWGRLDQMIAGLGGCTNIPSD